jgi:hypothetical protein
MIELRTRETLSRYMLSEAVAWRDHEFVWKKWGPPEGRCDHTHCRFCSACICDARDRVRYDRPGPVEGGHYRHSFYAEDPDGTHIWVCRSCFKRIRTIANWTIRRTRQLLARPRYRPH